MSKPQQLTLTFQTIILVASHKTSSLQNEDPTEGPNFKLTAEGRNIKFQKTYSYHKQGSWKQNAQMLLVCLIHRCPPRRRFELSWRHWYWLKTKNEQKQDREEKVQLCRHSTNEDILKIDSLRPRYCTRTIFITKKNSSWVPLDLLDRWNFIHSKWPKLIVITWFTMAYVESLQKSDS